MTIRLIYQRTFHCYVILTLWIVILIAGIYKALESKPRYVVQHQYIGASGNSQPFSVRNKRVSKICNDDQGDESLSQEGFISDPSWKLRSIVVVTRHGDRGPLQHVRGISKVHCGVEMDDLMIAYQSHLLNLTASGHAFWVQQQGPFHGFPLLPANKTECRAGQLTMRGIFQLLKTGELLRDALHLDVDSSDVVVYSTRYRRTFQSALALLYGLVGNDVSRVAVLESASMSFCFDECACPAADRLAASFKGVATGWLASHPAVGEVLKTVSGVVFERPDPVLWTSPHAVRDALLAFVCHDGPWPCYGAAGCLHQNHVAGVLTYADWEDRQRWGDASWKKAAFLRAYGLLKNIILHMLAVISTSRPKIVLYSGHDYTMEYLCLALGISAESITLRYAARLVIELYQSAGSGAEGFYFRLLANGKDVTREISFCRKKGTLKDTLCKMESFVRFIHDDYFTMFNVTNFKDACTLRT